MFKIGDKAVYPAYGVGVIEAVEEKDIMGTRQIFFIFRTLDSDVTIMIPKENTAKVGLRKIIGAKEVPKVYKVLSQRDVRFETQTWNRRFRAYTEKINSGSLLEVAEVMRDLFLLKSAKDLSFGERKMLDTARNLLIKELAVAENIGKEKIEEGIRSILQN
ncbi:MAG TPA: CarD family transcriptional regulator [Thermodesulfobacteriota bacterium]|nr:CarD family transcriptional regulator [Thermodesulfobacteriota bacterium]